MTITRIEAHNLRLELLDRLCRRVLRTLPRYSLVTRVFSFVALAALAKTTAHGSGLFRQMRVFR